MLYLITYAVKQSIVLVLCVLFVCLSVSVPACACVAVNLSTLREFDKTLRQAGGLLSTLLAVGDLDVQLDSKLILDASDRPNITLMKTVCAAEFTLSLDAPALLQVFTSTRTAVSVLARCCISSTTVPLVLF